MSDRPFEWPLRVYYEDTDAQGVVYYANYFRFLERGRTEWLRSLGIEQDALLYDERRMFVVTSIQADFLLPARFNDSLVVTAELSALARASFDIVQMIYRDALDDELICKSSLRAAFLNADTLKPMRLPDSLFRD